MDKGVLAAGIGRDEAEALGGVVEFNGAVDHFGAFQFGSKQCKRAGFPCALRSRGLSTFADQKESQASGKPAG
ncbi:hypothetical protein D3C72_2390470 [compost metagenome]